jgi:type II secretory pathway pseudopilin PulG
MSGWREAHGFSIVEVLTAATLVATALVGLAHLLILAGNASRTARAQSVAVLLAVGVLEELSGDAAAFSSIPEAGTDRVDANGTPFDDPARTGVPSTYARRWSAGPLPGDPSMLLLEVVVIPWAGRSGVYESSSAGAVTLTMVKARRAP